MIKKRIWFKTHNDDKSISAGGTSYKGCMQISYNHLVNVLGEPSKADEYKTDAQWIIRFRDKTIATVYNYKNGKNYLGSEGTATVDILDWNIGGTTPKVMDKIKKLFGGTALEIRSSSM